MKRHYLTLKLLLHRFFSEELWSAWDIVSADNLEYLAKHKKKSDQLLLNIPTEYRKEFQEWQKMKVIWLQRKSASRLDKKDRAFIDGQLAQALKQYNQIEAVNRAEGMMEEERLRKLQK